MAQFDVYRNPNPATAGRIPYFVDIQTEYLDGLSTRVVVPLVHRDGFVAATRLNPFFAVEGAPVVMATAELAAIRRTALGERVDSLAEHRHDIVAAIDFLVTGI